MQKINTDEIKIKYKFKTIFLKVIANRNNIYIIGM